MNPIRLRSASGFGVAALATVVVIGLLGVAKAGGGDGAVLATGHGSTIDIPFGPPGFRTFSFNAVEHADGSLSGQVQWRADFDGIQRHATIERYDRFGFDDGFVVFQGRVTHPPTDVTIVFAVKDNGNGRDPADQITAAFPFVTLEDVTEDILVFLRTDGLGDIEAGSIQVFP